MTNPCRRRVTFRLVFEALLALLVSPGAWGQELPVAKPEAVGLSPEKLALIGPALEALVTNQQIAGAVTIIARQGQLVYWEAVGQRDVASGLPMERDTIMRIHSMTKPITSVAILMLMEDGQLGLDDPVGKFLPEMKGLKVFVRASGTNLITEPARREPTVRDLLRHTAGLTYGFFSATPVDQAYRRADLLALDNTLTDLTRKLGGLPLQYQPGTVWNYSFATDVLGRLVEVVSGKPLDVFLAERILQPLDMRDTGFSVPPEKLARFAATHGVAAGKLCVSDAPGTSPYRAHPSLLSGGGGLVSTARDYLRFCQMLAAGGELGGRRLLRRETVQSMTANQLPASAMPIAIGSNPRPGVGFGYGFSVQVQRDPRSVAPIGEYGWGGAASTHVWISPKDELIVIALQQFEPYTAVLEQTLKPPGYDAIRDPLPASKSNPNPIR